MKTTEDIIKSHGTWQEDNEKNTVCCISLPELNKLASDLIEFTNRWIPVEEQLPPLNKLLQVKGIADKKAIEYDFAFFEFKKGLCNSHLIRATHWRPIELK